MVQTHADVIVVGGGVVGAATAYELAVSGRAVTLIERREPGWGASGRNQGFQGVHTRRAGPELALATWGRRRNTELARELPEYEMRECGGLTFFTDPQDRPFLEATVAARTAAGLDVELLDADAARARCEILPESTIGALWHPGDAHHDTASLCRALIAGARHHGARIVTDDIVRIDLEAGRVSGVSSASEHYPAGLVVVANGVWSNDLLASIDMRVPYRPLRLQAALTAPAPFRFEPIVYGPSAAGLYRAFGEAPGHSTERFVPEVPTSIDPALEAGLLDCIAQRPDGRVLLGCPVDYPGIIDEPSTAGIGWMLSSLSALMPQLSGLPLERAWAGVAPMTADFLPVIDMDPGRVGLVLNTGHAFGNLSASAAAALVRAHLDGEDVPVDLDDYRLGRPGLTAP